jgi:hypothetical protein
MICLPVSCQLVRAVLTPELTRRESTASCGKLTIKGWLIPLASNELLDRPFVPAFKLHHRLPKLPCTSLDSLVYAERPNARIDAAGSICGTAKFSITSELIPLASNELLDRLQVAACHSED